MRVFNASQALNPPFYSISSGNEHKRIERSFDDCSRCIDSSRLAKHNIIAVGINIPKEKDDCWSAKFEMVQNLAKELDVKDFILAESSLEETFLRLAGLDGEDQVDHAVHVTHSTHV
uniref:CwfJ_C_1 domain-containing protein n=1 Tax=Caenorhabditis japonica TaxID=281687 RepID=A0A8R1IG80_CAEJA